MVRIAIVLTFLLLPSSWPPLIDAILNNKSPRRLSRRYITAHREQQSPLTILCITITGGSIEEGDDTEHSADASSGSHSASVTQSQSQSQEPNPADATNRTAALLQETDTERKEINYISSLQETTLKAKQLFLDKIALVSAALLKSENDAVVDNWTNDEFDSGNDDEITLQSDLLRPGRKISVVTTAAIPWFTGTSVNPLLRAAYLSRLTDKINREHSNSTEAPERMVTLVIPWLEMEEDRLELYGSKYNFTTPEEQEVYIRKWLREEADMPYEADPETGIKILFYPGRYHAGLKSIFAMGDIISVIPDADADVCILEEPEHLNWYRAPGDGWTKKFRFVIGIIHTNYVEYAASHYTGLWTAPAIRVMSSAMVRAYCHVVIKLSDTLQTFAEEKERTSNVHGVRLDFLKEGSRRARVYNETHGGVNADAEVPQAEEAGDLCQNPKESSSLSSSKTKSTTVDVYFIGKILWAKGLDKMLELENYYKSCTGEYFAIDIYGNGPEEKEIKRAFRGRSSSRGQRVASKKITIEMEGDVLVEPSTDEVVGIFSTRMAKISKQIQATTQSIKSTTESIDLELPKSLHELRKEPIPSTFPGRVDHASLGDYKIFVNPSMSEVLCTTTAEALAMGKFVIVPVHPSNTFFMQFDNCLPYRNKLEFAANLHWALNREPEPLKPEQKRLLTWEAATERLVNASAITRREAKQRHILGTSKLDERIAWFHNELGKGARGDIVRRVLGGGPVSDQVAYELTKQQPMEDEQGLTVKFVGSSLAEAIRTTLSNAVPGARYRTAT